MFAITNDSSYVFPITNYQSGLTETVSAGELGQVSEVRQEGNLKFLYKLKVDEAALTKRNLVDKMTDYRKKTVAEATVPTPTCYNARLRLRKPDLSARRQPTSDFFDSEFGKDTSKANSAARSTILLQLSGR